MWVVYLGGVVLAAAGFALGRVAPSFRLIVACWLVVTVMSGLFIRGEWAEEGAEYAKHGGEDQSGLVVFWLVGAWLYLVALPTLAALGGQARRRYVAAR